MHCTRLPGFALGLVAMLLLAGCPAITSEDGGLLGTGTGRFASPGSGTGTSAAEQFGDPVGPPVTNPGEEEVEDTRTSGNSAATTTVAGTGAAAGAAVPDGLSTRFLGCDEPVQAAFWRSEILRLVNQERRAAGLGAVVWSETLAQQAAQYACELVYYDFFDHVNPVTGSTLRERAREFDYDYWIIGENLAAGQRTPVEVFSAWMQSPCHRENIMNPAFTELGVAVRFGGDYGYYWVQEFGRPFRMDAYPGPAYRDPECPR